MPWFVVWDEERGETREENADGPVEATDHESAAEEFARSVDRDGDYGYQRSGSAVLHVVALDETADEPVGGVQVFEVEAYAEPVYSARRRTAEGAHG